MQTRRTASGPDQAANQIIRMARRSVFSCAHFYAQPQFSREKNLAVFGACFTDHGHGHNYTLEAHYEGPIDSSTGLLVNLIDIDVIMKSVTRELDHHHLNFDVDFFKSHVPTTEVMARYLFDGLLREQKKVLPSAPLRLYKIRLFETEDLWVEESAE
jgi:6-pyruvoyltetrahydropterin/6-carboxytetrahydropterin synthase